MKTKYFEFSRNGGSEKYSEFTEEEYLNAKEEENLKEAIEMDTPLTAEGFYNYLQEQEVGGVIQLRHAKQGDMVNIAISQIVVTVVFAEEGWFCLLYTSPSPRDCS